MAASSMIIDTGDITDFENNTNLSEDDLDDTFSEIVTKFNAMLETATGHSHDGTNSRGISSTVAGLTIGEYAIAQIMGWLN